MGEYRSTIQFENELTTIVKGIKVSCEAFYSF